MPKPNAGEVLVEEVTRALWALALDAYHAFSDESSDDDRTASLTPLVEECAGAIGQAFVDAQEALE